MTCLATMARHVVAMSIYLYVNAMPYLLSALCCTLAPASTASTASTASNLGSVALFNGGRSQYLVIYGGLQLGLAIIFLMLAGNAVYPMSTYRSGGGT